jgi:hypothetical protein
VGAISNQGKAVGAVLGALPYFLFFVPFRRDGDGVVNGAGVAHGGCITYLVDKCAMILFYILLPCFSGRSDE